MKAWLTVFCSGDYGLLEASITNFEKLPCRPQRLLRRQHDASLVQRLNGVQKRRAVVLFQYVLPHLDREVGPQANKVSVKRRMVQRAERETVADMRLPSWFGIGNNVRSVEKFIVAQAAEGALPPVRFEHALAKGPLVQPHAHGGGYIGAARRLDAVTIQHGSIALQPEMNGIVHGDREGELSRIVGHNEHRPGREIFSRHDAVEIDERQAAFQRET